MNRSLYLSLLAASAACIIQSCQQAPVANDIEPDAGTDPIKSTGIMTVASPAIAYIDTTSTGTKKNRVYYNAIKVMDADGGNKRLIYTGPSTGSVATIPTLISPRGVPSWASTGNGSSGSPWRLAFSETANGSYASWVIKTVDLYVNSSGVPTGTNTRTVTTINDGRWVRGVAWRPGYNELAFASSRSLTGGKVANAEVYITDLSGNVTRIYPASGSPSATQWANWIAWSATGDSLALGLTEDIANDGKPFNDRSTIVLLGRDGTVLGSYFASGSYYQMNGFDWSHHGRIAFAANTVTSYDDNGFVTGTSAFTINTLDLSSGTVTQQFQSAQPSWSPDASSFVYLGNGGVSKRAIGSSSYTTLATGNMVSRPSWR